MLSTTTVKLRMSWSVVSQAATVGCEESLRHELAHDGVGLVDRWKVDRLPRLREGPGRRRRGDGLLGEPPARRLAAGGARRQSRK